MKRRTAAIAALLLPLAVPAYATSPVPPERPPLELLVLKARVVVVGTPTRFYFKGRLREVPDEYQRVFNAPGRGRSLYAVVRVDTVLKNETARPVGASIRISAPFLPQQYAALSEADRMSQRVFLLAGAFHDQNSEGTFLTYLPASDPLDLNSLSEVRKAISYQMGKPN